MKRVLLTVVFLCLSTAIHAATLLSENFDDVPGLADWTIVNNSTPTGYTDWFQGNDGVFGSHSGASDSYIAANFENADYGGEIDNWLITPSLSLNNGDTITFYSRTALPEPITAPKYEDRLAVLLNPFGTVNVADFTISLLTINPDLDGSYPMAWTQFTMIVSGLSGPTNATLAFHYLVPDTDLYGDYIGIDTLLVERADIPEPSTISLLVAGLGLGFILRRRQTARS